MTLKLYCMSVSYSTQLGWSNCVCVFVCVCDICLHPQVLLPLEEAEEMVDTLVEQCRALGQRCAIHTHTHTHTQSDTHTATPLTHPAAAHSAAHSSSSQLWHACTTAGMHHVCVCVCPTYTVGSPMTISRRTWRVRPWPTVSSHLLMVARSC